MLKMAQSDLERQFDEIEALSAIYGDQWHVEEEALRIFSLDITDCEEKTSWTLKLQVTLPTEYPSKAPPQYQLSAPWLRGLERQELCNQLNEIYLENIGDCIIFLWVEHIRQYLADRDINQLSADLTQSELEKAWRPESPESASSGDDGFDADLLEKMAACNNVQEIEGGDELTCPEIHHGEFLRDRKSVFQAHLAKVCHPKQVKLVMDSLLENRKIAEATHNIQAYRIMVNKNGNDLVYQGCVDDGEFHAGSRMLHLLQIVNAENVLVVVTRWYGGVHLGPDRFKHINSLTRQILEEHDFIKDKDDKKRPKTGKKGRRS